MVPLIVSLHDSMRISGLIIVIIIVKTKGLRYLSIAVGAYHGPAVNPRTRRKGEYPAHSTTVLEHQSVPFSMLSVNDSALSCKRKASESALKDYLTLIRTLDILASITDFLASCPWPCNAKEVIHTVVLDDTATLVQSFWLAAKFQHLVSSSLLHASKVGFEFGKMDVSAAREHIYPSVIIEEERRIVVGRQATVQLPSLCRVVSLEDHRLVRIIIGYEKSPESAVIITQ